ncbi:MAG: ATP-binding protein [Mycoplasmoidaceae bacterium]|nr:ATP-binding protein [Mycoplasmoidaceae bacterium]
MKKTTESILNLDEFSNLADLTSEQLDMYQNHPLVKKLNLTDKEFSANFGAIRKMVDQENACASLTNRCVNSSNIHIILARENGKLVQKAVYCQKMKDLNKSLDFAKNYLYRSFPNQFLSRSLSKEYFKIPFDVSMKKMLATFLKYIRGEKKLEHGAYLYGDFGIGKSYLCQAFANDLARNNKTVAYCFLPDFVHDLKQGFEDSIIHKKNEQIINNFKKADVLFLDDIGAEETNK